MAREDYFLRASNIQNHHGGLMLMGDYIYCGARPQQGLSSLPRIPDRQGGLGGRQPATRAPARRRYDADSHLYFRYQDGRRPAAGSDAHRATSEKGSFTIPEVSLPELAPPRGGRTACSTCASRTTCTSTTCGARRPERRASLAPAASAAATVG